MKINDRYYSFGLNGLIPLVYQGRQNRNLSPHEIVHSHVIKLFSISLYMLITHYKRNITKRMYMYVHLQLVSIVVNHQHV